MKQKLAALAAAMTVLSAGCRQDPASGPPVAAAAAIQNEANVEHETITQAAGEAPRILIAYFTRLDNTEAEFNDILQGGGPYGSLGNSLDEADLDAVSSASIQVIDGEVVGSTEAVARMIYENTDGDLFSIQTVQDYSVDYNTLISQGGEERNQGTRPELSSHVENMQDYDIIFLGFPNWWHDMPMPLYSFLEEYDFSGKTVIPFVTSAGSGFSGTIGTIQDTLPEAVVVKDGFQVQMRSVTVAKPDVDHWIDGLKITP